MPEQKDKVQTAEQQGEQAQPAEGKEKIKIGSIPLDQVDDVIIDAVEDVMEDVAEGIEEIANEPELMAESTHPKWEHFFLRVRNVAVTVAVVLFISSLFMEEYSHTLKAVAYFFGSAAYFSEIFMMTDLFSKKMPAREMFMAYCFGPLYILLGISYLLE